MILTPELVRLLYQVEAIRTILGLAISKMNQPWEEMAFIKRSFLYGSIVCLKTRCGDKGHIQVFY